MPRGELRQTIIIGESGNPAEVDSSGNLQTDVNNTVTVSGTVSVSEPVSVDDNSGSLTVDQSTHDNLNANANLQVGDSDVGVGNPVPISDNSSSLTVDQSAHDSLQCNANLQVADADVSGTNPVLIEGRTYLVSDKEVTSTGDTQVLGAPGSGTKYRFKRLTVHNLDSTDATAVEFQETTLGVPAATGLGPKYIRAYGGEQVWEFAGPGVLQNTTNAAVDINVTGANNLYVVIEYTIEAV